MIEAGDPLDLVADQPQLLGGEVRDDPLRGLYRTAHATLVLVAGGGIEVSVTALDRLDDDVGRDVIRNLWEQWRSCTASEMAGLRTGQEVSMRPSQRSSNWSVVPMAAVPHGHRGLVLC